jgi:hypothetical protein
MHAHKRGRLSLKQFFINQKPSFHDHWTVSSSELAPQADCERRIPKRAGDETRTRDSLLGRHIFL